MSHSESSENPIRYVAYDHRYAVALAELWNESRDNFGGFSEIVTSEAVIREESSSDHRKLWLAMDGEKAVGYCKLSDFSEEKDTLYIHLVNVHPDYQGKGIGKTFVLMCVEETMKLGFPRLDLYTWPGNVKAVPLYKKCGFFWVYNPLRTHFCNFIPEIANHGLTKDWFQQLDWVRDNQREIGTTPDGQKTGEFEYFSYVWQNQDTRLEVEYERMGRALRKIVCPDFSIEVILDNPKKVWGQSHPIRYRIQNHTDHPLAVSIRGQDRECVRNETNLVAKVDTEVELEGQFFLEEPRKEYKDDEQGGFPTIAAVVEIQGKKGVLSIGVHPVYPLQWTVKEQDGLFFEQTEGFISLDLENSYDSDRVFRFSLPSSECVTFHQPDLSIPIPSKAKKSRSIPVQVRKGSYYIQTIDVSVDGDPPVQFQKEMAIDLCTQFGMYGGVTKEGALISVNGVQVVYNKKLSWVSGEIRILKDRVRMRFPSCNISYNGQISEEFFRGEAKTFAITEHKDAMELTCFLEGEKGVEVEHHFLVHMDGRIRTWFEIVALHCTDELVLRANQIPHIHDGFLPYKGRIIQTNRSFADESSDWDFEAIDENWLYARVWGGKDFPLSMWWDKDLSVTKTDWLFSFEEKIGRMPEGSRFVSKPVWLGFSIFRDWEALRSHALGGKGPEKPVIEPFEILINKKNPIITETPVQLECSEIRNIETKGEIRLNGAILGSIDEKHDLTSQIRPGLNRMTMQADTHQPSLLRERLVFRPSGTIQRVQKEAEGLEIYEVMHDALQFRVAPGFSNGIYSMTYEDREILDHSFPQPGPRQWENPWCGGIIMALARRLDFMKEAISAEFYSCADQFGTQWQGIRTTIRYHKAPTYAGLVHRSYFVTLEGCPLIALWDEVLSTVEKTHSREYTVRAYFGMDEHRNQYFHQNLFEGASKTYGGYAYREVETEGLHVSLESDQIPISIFFANDHADRGYLSVGPRLTSAIFSGRSERIPAMGQIRSKPAFLILSDQRIERNTIRDLCQLEFSLPESVEIRTENMLQSHPEEDSPRETR